MGTRGSKRAKRAKSGRLVTNRLRPGPKRVQKRARKWAKRGAKRVPDWAKPGPSFWKHTTPFLEVKVIQFLETHDAVSGGKRGPVSGPKVDPEVTQKWSRKCPRNEPKTGPRLGPRPAGRGPICLTGVEKMSRRPPGGGAMWDPKREPFLARFWPQNGSKRGPGLGQNRVPFLKTSDAISGGKRGPVFENT